MKKIILAGMALTVLALACGEEEGVTPNVDYRVVPTSPRAVLVNVETAFNRRDINLLKAMLSPNFVFYFDPDDVGQNPPGGSKYVIPETWPYAEFTGAVTKLYKNAYSVSLTIPTTNVGEPGANETIYNAENINIKLLVMVDEINGYIANAGYCNFEFERYESPGGKKFWRLTKWWDNTNWSRDANPGVAPTSLGKILALYKLPF